MESCDVQPRVLIVGAGWIGSQIALRMACHNVALQLYDKDPAACQRAIGWMGANHRDYIDTTTDRLRNWRDFVTIAESLAGCAATIEIVVECVPEQISLKRRVLRELSDHFSPPVIIASNSSFFVPSLLARFVRDQTRFANLHFHAPLYRSTIADVVGCENTAPEVIARLCSLAETIGQDPLVLHKEHPGYVFNWMLQSLLKSALELAATGVAEPEEIDRSWRAVSGMDVGPFGIMDEIGLDLIFQGLSNARWSNVPQVPIEQLLELLKRPIAANHLGVKTGRGFYDHP